MHRVFLTKLFALALRSTTLKIGQQFKHKGDKRQCANLSLKIGGFKPLLSVNQATAIQALMFEIDRREDPLPDNQVLAFMHTFLLHTFTHTYPVTQEVSSILEQVIILHCLTEDEEKRWRSATWMYSVITVQFRLAKELVVNAAVLGGRNAQYEQLPPLTSIPNFIEESKEPDMIDDAGSDMEDTTLSFLNEDLDQEPETDENAGVEGRTMEPFNLVLK